MSTALRQQIDRTIELAIASGFGLTITIQPPGVEPATEAEDWHGLHPERTGTACTRSATAC
jgi:hypothetical protein